PAELIVVSDAWRPLHELRRQESEAVTRGSVAGSDGAGGSIDHAGVNDWAHDFRHFALDWHGTWPVSCWRSCSCGQCAGWTMDGLGCSHIEVSGGRTATP